MLTDSGKVTASDEPAEPVASAGPGTPATTEEHTTTEALAVAGETPEPRTPASGTPAAPGASPRPPSPQLPDVPVAPRLLAGVRKPRRLFTRDTARPEGGGRAAPGDAPAPIRQWPLLAVLGGVGLGLLVVALDAFRAGTLIVGLSLLLGALLRRMLPEVGMLAVRSRFTDLATYGGLGLAIVLLSMMAQPDPWVEIPFLEDVVHFTVR